MARFAQGKFRLKFPEKYSGTRTVGTRHARPIRQRLATKTYKNKKIQKLKNAKNKRKN